MTHRPCAIVSFFLGFAAASLAAGQTTAPAAGKTKITVSRETTFLTGPLNPDGTVNYLAAINAMRAQGVTIQNNAAVLLISALGPEMLSEKTRANVLKQLDMPQLPAKGMYFVGLEAYAASQVRQSQTDNADLLDKAMSGPWSAADLPIIDGWLKANENPLTLVVAASKLPRYYIPMLDPGNPPAVENALLPNLGLFREVNRSLIARSMCRLGKGDAPGAQDDLLTGHRLARLIGQNESVIERLVGAGLEDMACGADWIVAGSGKQSAAQAKAHLAAVQSLAPLPSTAETVDGHERLSRLDMVAGYWRDPSPRKVDPATAQYVRTWPGGRLPDLNWDAVLRATNLYHNRVVDICRIEDAVKREAAAKQFTEQMRTLWDAFHSKDVAALTARLEAAAPGPAREALRTELTQAFADWVIGCYAPMTWPAELMERSQMYRQLAEVALALAAFKVERGKYPEKLDELAPTYLKAIPNDRFNGKALVYKRQGAGILMYSVGRDLKDDGGTPPDDIVVRVPQ